MDINAHFVRKITAEAGHSPHKPTHWIELTIHEQWPSDERERSSKIVFFMHGPNSRVLVDKYVAAINGANVETEIHAPELEASE